MAAVSLKSIDGAGSPDLSIEDFLDLKAYEWTSEGRDQSDPVDAVVSNPPYSRSQLLTEDEKDAVNTQISREAGIELHGKSPLYVYFLIHATQFVKPGGKQGSSSHPDSCRPTSGWDSSNISKRNSKSRP